MAKLNVEYLTSLQTSMREVAESAFEQQVAETNFNLITNTIRDEAKSVMLYIPVGGDSVDLGVDPAEIHFSQLDDLALTYNYERSSKGLEINREDFTDGPRGAKRAADWARSMGASAAYLPQRLVWKVITDNTVSQIDNLPLFHTAHPNSPRDNTKGTYANLFTGTAGSGSANNPGALRIDAGVTLDVAYTNLGRAIAAIRNIKQADGVTPRALRAKTLFVAPNQEARALQLTGANFLGTTGSSDTSSVTPVRRLNVVVVDELESDGSWYLGADEIAGSQIGAVTFWDREPFSIHYLSGQTDASLDAANVLRWHGRGRHGAFPGLAFKIFKIETT